MPKKTEVSAKPEDKVPEQRKDPPFTLRSGAASFHALAATQCIRSAPWSYLRDDEPREMMAEASMDLYLGLQPKDALEATLSMLLVGVTNASLDCLSQAARVPADHLEHRDLSLRHGFKGAQVAAELAQALKACRGKEPSEVKVGNVTVESGGQAIVGTVQTGPREKASTDSSGNGDRANQEVANEQDQKSGG